MDCQKVIKTIEEQFDSINSTQYEHIASCQNCSKYYESAKRIKTLFSNYSCELDDENGEDFDNSLFIRLQKAEIISEKAKRVRPSILQIASALFFVMILLTTVIYFSGTSIEKEGEFISSTETELNSPVRIVLEYESDRDIQSVEVLFRLDKGVRFYSENEKISSLDSFVWKGELKKGTNQIPFIVSVIKEGSWNIMTEAGFEGLSHRHRITFVSSNGKIAVTLYKLANISDNT